MVGSRKKWGVRAWACACCGVVAAVCILALLAVNMHIQSADFRERIQGDLGRALGMRVQISRIGFTPWGGVSVQGVTATGSGNRQTASVPSVRARLDLPALFERRLVIRQLTVESPALVIREGARSEPRPPEFPPQQEGAAGKTESDVARAGTPVLEDGAGVAPPEAPGVVGKQAGQRSRPWVVVLDELAIQGGELQIQDEDGRSIVSCKGITMQMDPADEETVRSGLLTVESVVVREVVHAEALRSSFRFDGATLDMPEVTASVEGGKLEGTIQLATQSAPIGYSGQIKLLGCDVTRLTASAGLPPGRVAGKLNATASLRGAVGDWTSAQGDFRVDLHDGSISQIDLFQTIGQALRIEELVEFQIEEGYAVGRVQDGLTTIDPLILRSPNLQVVSVGTIQPDARLNLESKLYIHKKIRKRMPGMAKSNLKKSDDPALADYQYLEFEVDGTLGHPRSNILERLVGDAIEDKVRGVLRGLLGE